MVDERSSARKVATQHHLIESLLRGLRAAVDDRDAERARARRTSVARALDAHFVLEEEHYFPSLREVRPELGSELASLVEEHAAMRGLAETLAAQVEAGDWAPATETAASLERTFHRHEKTERGVLEA